MKPAKKTEEKEVRNMIFYGMMMTKKSSKFRHKNDRRAKDARNVRREFE